MAGVLIRRRPCEDTQGRPKDGGDGDWSGTATSQGTSRIAGSHRKPGGGKEGFSVVLSQEFIVICYCSPGKLIYHPIHFHNWERKRSLSCYCPLRRWCPKSCKCLLLSTNPSRSFHLQTLVHTLGATLSPYPLPRLVPSRPHQAQTILGCPSASPFILSTNYLSPPLSALSPLQISRSCHSSRHLLVPQPWRGSSCTRDTH